MRRNTETASANSEKAKAPCESDVSAETTEFLARLAERYSCRDFAPVDIKEEVLAGIVADGTQAPSSCNQQQWHFIIVTDPVLKRELRDIAGGNHHFAECSALIYLCFQKGWTHNNFSVVQSVAGACYHMMLSAHLRGYSSIWNAGIGDHQRLRELLKLPPTFEVQGALAIGASRDTAPRMKAPRRPSAEVQSWNGFARPEHTLYPFKPADAYPYFEIRNEDNPFAEWDPTRWTWDQVADFRGYAVWAKSPLAGVYVSRRQGGATDLELAMLAAMPEDATVVDVMPWGGTSTAKLQRRLPAGARLDIAELSPHNISFIMERLSREGCSMANVSASLMRGPALLNAESSVDLLVALQILEHMPDPLAFLDEVRRVLRPGGQFVVSIRNRESEYGRNWATNQTRGQVPNQGPFTPLPAQEVREWLAERFLIEFDAGIDVDVTNDNALSDDEMRYKRDIYAARCRLRR